MPSSDQTARRVFLLYHTLEARRKSTILNTIMDWLRRDIALTGNMGEDVTRFLDRYGCSHAAPHVRAVAREAERLAARFGVAPDLAAVGGWLHDVSVVVPVTLRAVAAEQWDLRILPEERAVPMILHQKLSTVIARRVFDVEDESVLTAIGCHTTLRANASALDKVVFLADKVAWDQPGAPPYLDDLRHGLTMSLDAGVCVYLNYLWTQRTSLPVVHPWLAAAYAQLCAASCPSG